MARESDQADVTREGIKVTPGQIWRDMNDRQKNRLCKVATVADGKASMVNIYDSAPTPRATQVSIARMYKHSAGWMLVQEAPQKPSRTKQRSSARSAPSKIKGGTAGRTGRADTQRAGAAQRTTATK